MGDDGKYGSLVVELQEEEHAKGFYRNEERPEDVSDPGRAPEHAALRATL